jgi:DNA-binding winged helix-turn-helix (wHTH) protein/TolB-like protein/Tfp pilus assembly protein PilF
MTIRNSASSRSTLRIGDWQADLRTNELTRNGETVRLEPKAMEVLVFLAERAGQVVSREALLSALWPGMVVGDDALTQAVIKLRKSLQDTPRSPQYIETISKRGYRLIAAVERLDSGQAVESKPLRPLEATTTGRTRGPFPMRAAAAALACALLLAGAAAIYLSRQGLESIDAANLPGEETLERWAALPTITVTPFETIAAGGTETYLARGIAADLATDLSRLSGLRVVSPSPAAGSESSHERTARPGPRYLLSGMVQRTSDSLRINVRLTDGASGRQLWAERYDRPFRDVMAVQEEIISHLLQTLPVQVSEAERQRLARRYTQNLAAYDYFLRGKAAFLARQSEENTIAREMYRKAIELDPAFARAYAGLALTHADDYRNQWTTDGKRSLATASQLAETALQIDPDIPDVYAVLGYIRAVQHDHQRALQLHARALKLDPSYADAYAYIGATYTLVGQPARTIPFIRTAMRLNPNGGFIYFMVLGRAYLFSGDLEQASINLREALARNPADLESRVYMAATLVAAGDMQGARWEANEIRALQPDFSARKWLRTYLMSDERQKRQLRDFLAEVGL